MFDTRHRCPMCNELCGCYGDSCTHECASSRSERPADPAGEISGHTPWSDIKQRVLDRLQTENAKLEAQLLASQAECERVKGERNCLDDKVQALTRPVSDEAWKVIADAVETLTIWSRQDFTNPDGSTPMWNPTLRRLRNLLATRAQSTPPSPAPDAVRDALEIACAYGGIDGGHHKMWVIDQMVRRLTGDDYDAWVREHNKGEDGPDTYAWDQGIAP